MPELNNLSPASTTLLNYLDGELENGRALGDLQTMLASLWNKRNNTELVQDSRLLPKGYRGIAMPAYVLQHFGARLLRWGATAIRGDLGIKKAHIAKFIELVNALPTEQKEAEEVFDLAAEKVAAHVLAVTPVVTIPTAAAAQRTLESLLRTRSKGKVQQGLVYALVNVLYADQKDINVRTKAVYAGDAQSGEAGDIVVIRRGTISLAYEVKAMRLDVLSYEQAVRTHGASRTYPLVILATGVQEGLEPYSDVYTVNLEDFCVALLTEIVSRNALTAEEAIRRVLTIYNEHFVSEIERNPALRVEIGF
jgi:hypothetical protein